MRILTPMVLFTAFLGLVVWLYSATYRSQVKVWNDSVDNLARVLHDNK